MSDYNLFQPKLAREIMVTNLVTLRPKTPVLESISNLVRSQVKGAPVVGPNREYYGIFTERCCLNVLKTYAGNASWAEYFTDRVPVSADIMNRKLTFLTPAMDVFEAVNVLLANRISGAPVIDSDDCFLGIFSEKSSMDVLIGATYDRLPGTRIETFMNTDRNRTIDESLDLAAIVQRFLDTPYRRLPVLRDNRVVGQISRQDVLVCMEGLVSHFADDRREDTPEPTEAFMDTDAKTVSEDVDIFSVANVFRESDHRRVPVVTNGRLVGLITRKDLLRATNELLNPVPAKKASPLYLSSVADARPPGY